MTAPRPAARLPATMPTRPTVAAEIARLRALLLHAAEAVDLALDCDPRVAGDLLAELADELYAELVP